MDEERWIEIGRLGKPHGLRGGLRVRLYNPESTLLEEITDVRIGLASPGQEYRVRPKSAHSVSGILLLEGVEDRNAAELLRGKTLWVRRSALPPLEDGEYYHCDLIGLKALDEEGRELGEIRDVFSTGAHDVYVIQGEVVGELMVPAVAEYVDAPDLEKGSIAIHDWRALRV